VSIPPSGGAADAGQGLHVPAGGGITDLVQWRHPYTTKLTAQQSSGALGFIEVTCPPGGGPSRMSTPGTARDLLLEISGRAGVSSQGDKVFTAGAGDLVFITARPDRTGFPPSSASSRRDVSSTPLAARGLFIEVRC